MPVWPVFRSKAIASSDRKAWKTGVFMLLWHLKGKRTSICSENWKACQLTDSVSCERYYKYMIVNDRAYSVKIICLIIGTWKAFATDFENFHPNSWKVPENLNFHLYKTLDQLLLEKAREHEWRCPMLQCFTVKFKKREMWNLCKVK